MSKPHPYHALLYIEDPFLPGLLGVAAAEDSSGLLAGGRHLVLDHFRLRHTTINCAKAGQTLSKVRCARGRERGLPLLLCGRGAQAATLGAHLGR